MAEPDQGHFGTLARPVGVRWDQIVVITPGRSSGPDRRWDQIVLMTPGRSLGPDRRHDTSSSGFVLLLKRWFYNVLTTNLTTWP